MLQPTSAHAILQGVTQHGVAQGPQKLMDMEEEAANLSISSGIYVTWRTTKHNRKDDCTRIGPRSLCFCGHSYSDHMRSRSSRKPCSRSKKSKGGPKTGGKSSKCGDNCTCKGFEFIPQRPEEIGDWWLTRRKGFNVNTWRCKCRCGCAHDHHDAGSKHCKDCGCGMFQSNFLCIACDGTWEEHTTLWEDERERKQEGRS